MTAPNLFIPTPSWGLLAQSPCANSVWFQGTSAAVIAEAPVGTDFTHYGTI